MGFKPQFGDLGVTYALYLYHIGKAVIDFLYVTIEHYSLAVMAEVPRAKISPSLGFVNRLGHFYAEN